MSVRLNKETFTLEGKCEAHGCGSELYCIEIETGEALCSNPNCDRVEHFDPKEFSQEVKCQ